VDEDLCDSDEDSVSVDDCSSGGKGRDGLLGVLNADGLV